MINHIVTPAQCRAARALINWNQAELADAANVSRQTINDFETGKRVPIPNNLVAIKKAIESVGVRFVDETESPLGDSSGRGVRFQRAEIEREIDTEARLRHERAERERLAREAYLRKVRDEIARGGGD